ncbi:hypothetical protein UP09_30200 [Bradyrhizobium sp. LTSP885]|uniref:hypothetical protein n=1 Tax=Bradyrhizobium sp. LTSP885 TaxID=1619232 RepID=UPI0005CAABFD|nr:hypothetical protein [Bradyrhizobium sp. LTSP885]KJC35523.1 hypothetical protein UP09_30200 [Bradyrhizobium sp. LTSP885]
MNIATDIALVLHAAVTCRSAILSAMDTVSDSFGEALLLPILVLTILRFGACRLTAMARAAMLGGQLQSLEPTSRGV